MEEEAKKYLRWRVILAVLFLACMYHINTSSFVVLIESVAQEMIPKGMQLDQIGWLISLPSLLMIPGVLLNSVLARVVRMRTLMVFSWALFGLSGAAIFFMQTTETILVCRAVMGFAIGLCQPFAKALPSRMYDDAHRGKIIGYVEFVGGFLSLIGSLAYGVIAENNWRYAMFIYLGVAAIFIILAFAFVPNLPIEKRPDQAKDGTKARPFGLTVWVMTIAAIALFVIGAVIQIKSSTLVTQVGAGGSTESGFLSMANTAGIVVGGLLFGFLYDKLQRWLFPLALVATTACYFWFANSTDLVSLCISGAIANCFAIGILMVYIIVRVTYTTPPQRVTAAITIVTLGCYIGQVFTTPFVNIIEANWGGELIFPPAGGQPAFFAGVSLNAVAIVFAAITVIAFIYVFATRNMNFGQSREQVGEQAALNES